MHVLSIYGQKIHSVIYFNGEKIKFRGVNRHDSDPETGFTISVEQLKKDLMTFIRCVICMDLWLLMRQI